MASAASTTLIYNGVTLPFCDTKEFSQSIEREDSTTDQLGTSFRVKVESLVQVDTSHFAAVNYAGISADTASDMERMLASQLMQDRGNLEFSVNGAILLRSCGDEKLANIEGGSSAASYKLDIKNGPKVVALNVRQISGRNLFRVEFTVETCIVVCPLSARTITYPNGAKNIIGVLNNRWSMTETRDQNWYSTKVIEGTLRVVHAGLDPQLYRYAVLPPLMNGYRRTSQRFTRTKDGLNLNYEITDTQVDKVAPWPASEWQCVHTEATGRSGIQGMGNIAISLKGPPGVSKLALVQTGLQIVEAKFGDLRRAFSKEPGKNVQNSVIPMSFAIIDHVHDSKIEIRCDIQRPIMTATVRNALVKNLDDTLEGKITNYQVGTQIVVDAYDSSTPAGFFQCYLQRPCDQTHSMIGAIPVTKNNPGLTTKDTKKKPKPYPADSSKPADDPTTGVSNSQDSYPYTFIDLDNEYRTCDGVIGLPIARSENDQKGKSGTAFIAIFPPQTQRIFTMKAERIGNWPEIPSASPILNDDPNGIQERLIEHVDIPDAPQLMPDGRSLKYSVQLKYTYIMSRSPTENEKLRGASSPIDRTTAASNVLSLSQYKPSNGQGPT